MNENSRKGETSERVKQVVDEETSKNVEDVEDIKRIFKSGNVPVETDKEFGSGTSGNQVSDPGGSSCDDTGPTSDLSPPNYKDSENDAEVIIQREDEVSGVVSVHSHSMCLHNQEKDRPPSQTPSQQLPIVSEPSNVQITPNQCSGPNKSTVGPPPSYSFVMKQKRRFLKTIENASEVVVTDRPPPPMYPGMKGLYQPTESGNMERLCNIPSFSDPIWRPRPQPALCRRCGVLIQTTTHSHDSVATHVVALALCLFGCWPCCLLPYCMNSCKNTYHHCPICQGFLGTYTPW